MPAPPPEPDETAAPTFRACRILIVDDNKDAADSMALSVQLAGHTVCTAYDGQEGMELAFAFAPDVLLLDLGMPGLNGFEIARRIRQQPWGKDLDADRRDRVGPGTGSAPHQGSRLQRASHQAGQRAGAAEGVGECHRTESRLSRPIAGLPGRAPFPRLQSPERSAGPLAGRSAEPSQNRRRTDAWPDSQPS